MGTQGPKTSGRPFIEMLEPLPYQAKAECEVCHGAGWLHPQVGDRVNYSKVVPCSAPGCLLASYTAHRSGVTCDGFVKSVGVIAAEQTFENFQKISGTEKSLEHAKAFADGKESWFFLLLYGSHGNGKSHLCSAVTRRLIHRGAHPQMIMADDMLNQLKVAMKDHTTDALLEELKARNPLIIDELAFDTDSPWDRDTLEELLTARFNRGMPTMLTTNLDFEQLPARLKSRFGDKKYSRVVHNTAPDYRKSRR